MAIISHLYHGILPEENPKSYTLELGFTKLAIQQTRTTLAYIHTRIIALPSKRKFKCMYSATIFPNKWTYNYRLKQA